MMVFKKKYPPCLCMFLSLCLLLIACAQSAEEPNGRNGAGSGEASVDESSDSDSPTGQPNGEQPQNGINNQEASDDAEKDPLLVDESKTEPNHSNDSIEKLTAHTQEEARRFQINPRNHMISPVEGPEPDEKFVLLTFDDTPAGHATGQILDILDTFDAKAIFFVNGHYAARYKELLHEIYNRGHMIGNHTWWHIYIRRESEEKVREEILRLNDFLEEKLGERPVYFRPPFGQNSDVSLSILKEEGMQTINWSNGSLDWELKSSEAIVKQVITNIKNGDNILFHDKQITADALEDILSQLKEMGYQFVLPTEVFPPE